MEERPQKGWLNALMKNETAVHKETRVDPATTDDTMSGRRHQPSRKATVRETVDARFLFSKNLPTPNSGSPDTREPVITLPERLVDYGRRDRRQHNELESSPAGDRSTRYETPPGSQSVDGAQNKMRPVPTRQMPLRRSDLRPEDNPLPDLRPDMQIWGTELNKRNPHANKTTMSTPRIDEAASPSIAIPTDNPISLPFVAPNGANASTPATLAVGKPREFGIESVTDGPLNPAASTFLPKRDMPQFWQTQCRWTFPPDDDGKGVDNCRFGSKCNFGHPGDEYYQMPGVKQTFVSGINITTAGGAVFRQAGIDTHFTLNPGVMNQQFHGGHQVISPGQSKNAFSSATSPKHASATMPSPPYQATSYPSITGHNPAPFARPTVHHGGGYNGTPRDGGSGQSNSNVAAHKGGTEGNAYKYSGPVIVRSPSPIRRFPPAERMAHRRAHSSASTSSKSSHMGEDANGEANVAIKDPDIKN